MLIPANIKEQKRTAVFVLVLILTSLLQYSLSIRNDFVWDAKGVFLMDPSVKQLDQFPRYFTEPSTLPSPEHLPQNSVPMLKYYRPVMKLVHAIEHQTFGSHPAGYNAVNILLNAALVVLAFFFIRSITGNAVLAFAASLLYAVNPTRVEVVSWSYSDSYIFTGLFTLLTLLLYRQGHLIASLGFFVLALFTHETAAVIPAAIVLYEVLIQEHRTRAGFYKAALYFVLLGVFMAIRRTVVGPLPLPDTDLFTLVNTVSVIIARYVKIFFVPDAPITVYTYTKGMFSLLSAEVVASYAVVAALTAAGVHLWLKQKEYLFWYLWFFLFCAISFNVGRFGEYLLAEKLLYTASLGFCVLIAAPAVIDWPGKKVYIVLLACLIFYHVQATALRQRYWKDTTTYLQAALKFAPDFTIGRLALAVEYQMRGEYDRALDESYEALALQPGLVSAMPAHMANLYYLKGEALSAERRYDNALQEYQRALQWNADHSLSLSNIGGIYHIQGKQKQAMESWLKAIRSDPSNPVPYYNVGMVLQGQGDINSALEYYQKYLSLEKDPPPSARALVEELNRKRNR